MPNESNEDLVKKIHELDLKISNLEGQILILKEMINKSCDFVPISPYQPPYQPYTPWYTQPTSGGRSSSFQSTR